MLWKKEIPKNTNKNQSGRRRTRDAGARQGGAGDAGELSRGQGGPTGQGGGSEPVFSEGLSQSPGGWGGESSRQKDCIGQRPYRGAVSGLLEEQQGGWGGGGAKVE